MTNKTINNDPEFYVNQQRKTDEFMQELLDSMKQLSEDPKRREEIGRMLV